jgi:hypothetical protein
MPHKICFKIPIRKAWVFCAHSTMGSPFDSGVILAQLGELLILRDDVAPEHQPGYPLVVWHSSLPPAPHLQATG